MSDASMIAPSAPTLAPGRNCWRIERAAKMSVIVDADDYFRLVRDAMSMARRRIMLVGWDFDAEVILDRTLPSKDGPDKTGPESVGHFIHWLVRRNPDLEVFLLRWDVGALKTLTKPRTVSTLLRWLVHPRIHLRLDGHHPFAASQHQKIVVLDDATAFCGGIDMTVDRWDTPAHRDGDPGRRRPSGASYGPWHDATTALDGPIAGALADICRARWKAAGGREIAPAPPAGSCWPQARKPDFIDVPVAIARTQPDMDDQDAIHEIERLYADLIGSAKRWIYAESQYFASRIVAQAIARRLEEPDGPEIVMLNPCSSEGWLEPIAMDTARARLMQALERRDTGRRFRLYHPRTEKGVPIYVHAKVLIIDDNVVRVGSSNLNNRSMRLDTECDIVIDASLSPDEDASRRTIADLRNRLLAEHLGREPDEVARLCEETGSLIRTVETLRQRAGRTLEPYVRPDLSTVEAELADSELLDPEGPDEMFEPLAKRGLFRKNSFDFRIRRRGHRSSDDRPD